MVRTYLFHENIYPILIREMLKYEEAIETNNQKAINSILEHVIIDGSPLSERKRSSLEFIKNNRDRILADIRTIKNDPHAHVYHPSSLTYPAKMRVIATALLSCEEQFRMKNFQDPDFRAIVKREVNELATKEGLRLRHLDGYFVDHYDRLLALVDEIKAGKNSQIEDNKKALSPDDNKNGDSKKSSKQENDEKDEELVDENPESKPEDSPENEKNSEDGTSSKDQQTKTSASPDEEKLHLQVKVKKLSSQEVRGGVSINFGKDKSVGIEEEECSMDGLEASEVDPESDADQGEVKKGAGTPMDVDLSKSEDKKSSKTTGSDEQMKENGETHGQKDQTESVTSEKLSETVEEDEKTKEVDNLEDLEDDDLEVRVKSLEINEWAVGQMAWTLIDDLCYWPCMVIKDASNQHMMTQQIGDKTITKIHVKCFGEPGVDKWVYKDSLKEGGNPDDTKMMNDIFNRAVAKFQKVSEKDTHERLNVFAPNKRRPCSQSVAESQEPVTKKVKLDEKKS